MAATPIADRSIHLLTIEPDPVILSGLVTCLNRFPDLQVVAQAADLTSAWQILTGQIGKTVDIDLNARTVVTPYPVTGVLPIGNFSAQSLSADIQGSKVVLDGGVHLRINGRAGKGA